MKNKSDKQRKKDAALARIKKELPKVCVVCGRAGNDLAHILPRSLYPEYYCDPRNLMILCRDCHNLYDNDIEFRKKQTKILKRAREIDELATNRYFKL